VWFLKLTPRIVGNDLGPMLTEAYQSRYTYVTRFLTNTLSGRDPVWCDDVRTSGHEPCDGAVTAALHDAVADLSDRLGSIPARWQWSAVHRAVFPHQGLDAVRLLGPFISRSVPGAGDWSTVNAGTVASDHPFEQRHVASYREIIDLSERNDSRFIDAVGESGHLLSPHYADFLPDWRSVRYRPMRMDRAAIDRGAIGRLRLQPAR